MGRQSLRDRRDPEGDPLAWSVYQPFGALRSAGADIDLLALGFTGQYLDTITGLVHLRARHYDPLTGRFLSTDPVAPALTDPYVASYVYVRNMPTVAVDASGECVGLVPAGAQIGATVGIGAGTLALPGGGTVGGAVVGGAVGAAGGALACAGIVIGTWLFGSAVAEATGDIIIDRRPDPQTTQAHIDFVAQNMYGPDDLPPVSCRLSPRVCRIIAALGIATVTMSAFSGARRLEDGPSSPK